MIQPNLLIVGTGRCGTGYISKVLTDAGVPCGHEAYYNPVTWENRRWPNSPRPVESSWLGMPAAEQGLFTGRVVHQTRDTLATLSSFMNGSMKSNVGLRYAGFQSLNLHRDQGLPDNDRDWLAFMVEYLVEWLQRCDEVAGFTYRVEDVDVGLVGELGNLASRTVTKNGATAAVGTIPDTVNKHRDGPEYDWEDLVTVPYSDELYELAAGYGYV